MRQFAYPNHLFFSSCETYPKMPTFHHFHNHHHIFPGLCQKDGLPPSTISFFCAARRTCIRSNALSGLTKTHRATAPTSLTQPTLHSLFLITLQRHWPYSYSFDIQSLLPLLKLLRMVPHAWKYGTQAGPYFLFRYQFKCSAFLESLSQPSNLHSIARHSILCLCRSETAFFVYVCLVLLPLTCLLHESKSLVCFVCCDTACMFSVLTRTQQVFKTQLNAEIKDLINCY